MKIKTSELTRKALDWAVHYAQCLDVAVIGRDRMVEALRYDERSPSTDWSQGGPIIEREGIGFRGCGKNWCAFNWGDAESGWQYGPTPLIAAMRCYVASKFGDEVDVPDELIQGETA
jgi:Protein of unknown function (DUF2591)